MISKKIKIINEKGIHMRPAKSFCTEALKYQCLITLKMEEKNANAKSFLSVLAVGVHQGDEIELSCDGVDEQEAMQGMTALIESGLGEE